MAGKNSKTKKQTRPSERGGKTAQLLFALFAVILILSMVLAAVTNF